ncbi:MAG: ABC-F family ATP-binding cassette domain-containing protein [Syntrophomonadales bacterium]|jgi:ATP-binding cassette subfamily F protein 3
MILLQANRICKAFGITEVLNGASIVINEHERVGMVGPNGCGKSTFLGCITGDLTPDSGVISVAANRSVGYMQQLPDVDPDSTAWDAVMNGYADLLEQRRVLAELTQSMANAAGSDLERLMERYSQVNESYERADGYACEANVRRVMAGLGFKPEQFAQAWSTFSGGEKTRLNLARLLIIKPDILLLDEPTNHLDITSVEWLEDFLISYRGSVLVVSHDRRFLDRVATRIVELRNGMARSYPGNYSEYIRLKAEDDLAASRAYERQQEYIRKTEEYIRRYKAGIKSKQARGRQSQLERMERLEAVKDVRGISLRTSNFNNESANVVLTANRISKSFGGKVILQELDLIIHRGERLAVVGPNGCGKTTLLKMLVDELPADTGEVKRGSRVKIGYLAQERTNLDSTRTVLDELVYNFDITLEEARNQLGRMLFSGDDVFKRVGDLSGGEQGRLALLKLTLAGGNFLVLDEPTNHLDIDSCQAVEDMLAEFTGTLLIVSHDRYFLDQVVDEIIAIEDGTITRYQGNYSYYHQKAAEKRKAEEEAVKEKKSGDPRSQARSLEKEAKQRKRMLTAQLQEIEARIELLEDKKAELESLLSDPETYNNEIMARSSTNEFKKVNQDIESAYEEWETLLEHIELQEES